jgi:hypothetical protein
MCSRVQQSSARLSGFATSSSSKEEEKNTGLGLITLISNVLHNRISFFYPDESMKWKGHGILGN